MGRVEVHFLGTGDAVGSGGRFQTCFRVRRGEGDFLIDCGASALTAMRRFGVDPGGVDQILISHLHGDHFGGIPFFILDAQFGRRARPLQVAGPPGVEDRVKAAMEVFFPGSSRVERKFAVEFVELRERAPVSVGPLTVTSYPAIHPSGALSGALRVGVDGKIISYSGDTEWTDSLVEAARGADLFICEAYFFDKKVKYHLDFRTLREQRDRLECGRILLTHMNQDMLARLGEVDLEWAEDGKILAL